MIKIAICDDEEYATKAIHIAVSEYARQNNLQIEIETFLSGMSLLKKFNGYDLIFLDIGMPEIDGIETAKVIRINDMTCKIIYITSHANFALQALDVHAFGYVTKPFIPEKIFSLFSDFVRSVNTIKKQNTLAFKNAKESICFNADEVLYFEYCGNRVVKIVMHSNEKYFHCTLREVIEKAEKYGYALSHQSFVVNLLYVKSIKGEKIVMSNNDVLPLAQKRMVGFKNAHNQFLQVML